MLLIPTSLTELQYAQFRISYKAAAAAGAARQPIINSAVSFLCFPLLSSAELWMSQMTSITAVRALSIRIPGLS